MTVTIDSSAFVAYLLEENDFEELRDVVARGASSPAILVTESSNAILQATKRGSIDRDAARKRLDIMLDLIRSSNITLHAEEDLIQDAFRIAVDHNLAIYDSLFLALAQKLQGPLVSRDRRQIEVARKLGIEVLGA